MKQLEPGSRLVVASHNPGKVWEIKRADRALRLRRRLGGRSRLAEPEETEPTFDGNARLKALAAATGSGLPALADDSGLEVDALGGDPGIYSARWAGPGKDFGLAMQRVHDALDEKRAWDGTPPRANFISVLCLAWPTGEHRIFEGRVYGTLHWPPRGGNGFGYDPMFAPDGDTRTFGEMSPEAKYAISHRTRAFEAFKRDCLEHVKAQAPAKNPDATSRRSTPPRATSRRKPSWRRSSPACARISRPTARPGRRDDLATFLVALERAAATANTAEAEPRWRTLARTLLAASR